MFLKTTYNFNGNILHNLGKEEITKLTQDGQRTNIEKRTNQLIDLDLSGVFNH